MHAIFALLRWPLLLSCGKKIDKIMFAEITDGCVDIQKRDSWGALKAKDRSNFMENPPPVVIVHHSGTRSCTSQNACKKQVASIQRYHVFTNGWWDIGYNFLVTKQIK